MNHLPKSVQRIVLLSVLCVTSLIGIHLLFERFLFMSPQERTRAAMSAIKRRILRFVHQNGRLPSSLDEIPSIPNFFNEITDWWGNRIRFDVDPAGIITLRSPGGRAWCRKASEGMPVVLTFPYKTPTGEWEDELVGFYEE
jgi:hypothetical protein